MCKEVSDVCILHATWAGTNTAHPTLINTCASEQNQANKGKPWGKKEKEKKKVRERWNKQRI